MCGIMAYLGKKGKAGSVVFYGLKSLEYRGYDSWGVAIKNDEGKIYTEKHVGKIEDARLPKIKSNIGFGHTRWATHGGVTVKNCHPHTDCHHKFFVVHNGIVENFESIKNILIKKGHRFASETDTEVIAHLIEEKSKNQRNIKKVVFDTFKSLHGLNAIIVFYPQNNEFLAIKNSSPIVFGLNKKTDEYYLASDSSAILFYTNHIYFLEDEELLDVSPHGYTLWDKNQKIKPVKFIKLKIKKESFALGRFPHYMLKEIYEQPQVLERIIDNEKENIKTMAKNIKRAYGTYFIGCGSAYYATLCATYIFSKIANIHTNAAVGSEFSYMLDFIKETSLVIALSQSGETIDIISSIKKAKEKKAKIVALTNVLGSTLYRLADYKLLLSAGPEKCVLATKSFTAKIAFIYLLAYALKDQYDLGKRELQKAVSVVKKILENEEIKKLSHQLANNEHIYILGRGLSYPLALESALKIKEVSYIHAEGFAAGELKHGVIALIGQGTPVIVYNPSDETYEDTLSSAYEVKARGAYVIGIADKPNKVYDRFIKVADCQNATIVPNVVVAQLLAYHLALIKGLDPDKPRNLAKSVTVK